jgi:hypothetical protein
MATCKKINDMTKDKRGGARAGAGRKKLNKTMLHTYIDSDYLARLKEKAEAEHLTVGDWLVKHIELS